MEHSVNDGRAFRKHEKKVFEGNTDQIYCGYLEKEVIT